MSDVLKPLICARDTGEVEPCEKVPVYDVFDVELHGCHDNPEHIPGKRGGEG